LKNEYDLFVRNIKKIDDHMSVLRTDLEPLKENRLQSRKALINQVFPVISVTGVFAYDKGNKKLGKLVQVKFSELEKMKSDELKKYCIRVLKAARSMNEKLSDYGISGKHLDQLQQSLDQFIRDDEAFVQARDAKKKSGKKLDRRLRENNRLLKKKMDRMMQLFRETQKTFYNAYLGSRTVPRKEPAKPVKQQGEPASKKPGTAAQVKKEAADSGGDGMAPQQQTGESAAPAGEKSTG